MTKDSYSYDQLPSFLSIISRVETFVEKQGQCILAIDGLCGSGKSSFARYLARYWQAKHLVEPTLFHMDDFYVPSVMKTPGRMAMPGANVHHERFLSEVIRPLLAGGTIAYRTYNCNTDRYSAPRVVTKKPFIIVEGSYSMHPNLVYGYDLKLFLKHNSIIQLERILNRSDDEITSRFKSMWIPLENTYFSHYNIESECDYSIDTSDLW